MKKNYQKNLSEMQYFVTQQCGTEPAFDNEYWDEKRPGIYVDVISKRPLFVSVNKFDSGTGWPSFTRPVDETEIIRKEDDSLGIKRIEVRSRTGKIHLGHVFDDGPDREKQRYCINSAALKFIPQEEMEAAGYKKYLYLLEKENG